MISKSNINSVKSYLKIPKLKDKIDLMSNNF